MKNKFEYLNDSYSDHYKSSIKSWLKRYYIGTIQQAFARESALVPHIQFLYGHHLFQDEIENFKRTLARIKLTHEFISYSDAVVKIRNGAMSVFLLMMVSKTISELQNI